MSTLTPRQIVAELDKYIIGQSDAKKMVAIALRSRYRRRMVNEELRADIIPKNILMIGPTGVGKTEIARRLAKLVNAPFIKVEATKFTEVGYVGRDVESIIRDIIEEAVRLVKEENFENIKDKSHDLAVDRIVEVLAPSGKKKDSKNPFDFLLGIQNNDEEKNVIKVEDDELSLKRQQIKNQINLGLLNDMQIEIEVDDTSSSPMEIVGGAGLEEINFNLQDMLGNIFPKKRKDKKVSVKDALKILEQEEAAKLIDMEDIHEQARKRAEEEGIIFIDEIDKIAGKGSSHGPDISREGVQRDILPIVEGSTVNTKYGPVKTDHMLFIAAGAFHIAKVTDLIPELQGRFPVHVELQSLSENDFIQILTLPKNALTKQYVELLKTEGVELNFTDDGIKAIAQLAFQMNLQHENIGARRLHTVIEQVLMDISFEAPDGINGNIDIDNDYVYAKIKNIFKGIDMNKYII